LLRRALSESAPPQSNKTFSQFDFMYTPQKFAVQEQGIIRKFIQQFSFGMIISHDGKEFHDTHTPLFISDDLKILSGHIARANPQWLKWKESPTVKVIFHGPHSYISPRYYKSDFNVPTWNYTAISIDGEVEMIAGKEKVLGFLETLVSQYESLGGWSFDSSDERYLKLLDAIVCFEITISKIETKFKMNQNKSIEDQQSVIAHLEKSSFSADRETALFMKQTLQK
jgi:transcriptional regulator